MSEQHDTLPCPFCGDPMKNNAGIVQHAEQTKGCPIAAMGIPVENLRYWNLRSPAATSLPDGVEAALTLFNDALDIMFDGPDESDRAMAHKKWGEALQIVTTLTPAPAQPEAAGDVVAILSEIEEWCTDVDGTPMHDHSEPCGFINAGDLRRIAAALAHPPQAKLDGMEEAARYKAAWRDMHDALAWMQGCKQLPVKYLGWNLAEAASDLIAKAYPQLRPAIRAIAQQEQS